jgi:hypothetical protein
MAIKLRIAEGWFSTNTPIEYNRPTIRKYYREVYL